MLSFLMERTCYSRYTGRFVPNILREEKHGCNSYRFCDCRRIDSGQPDAPRKDQISSVFLYPRFSPGRSDRLILGNQVLGVLNFSDYSGDYTWTLVVMSFVAVGLPGIKFTKASGERIGSYFFYKLGTWALQFSFPSFSAVWSFPRSTWALTTASVC